MRAAISSDLHAFEGRCHCGAVAFTFRTSQLPERWSVRACQCSFCRAHGARTTADPDGSVTFHVADASKLRRYRFGTRSTDFIVCGDCGVYLAALLTSRRGQFATLNINTIRTPLDVPQAQPVSYDGESLEQRLSRRERRWTPVAKAV
ncbi:MAG: GFA family protein [Burkholderiales bacterium]